MSAIEWDEAVEVAASLKTGTKVRRVGGTLGHVRGNVDGRPVIRWWQKHKQRWRYEVLSPAEIAVGLWEVER